MGGSSSYGGRGAAVPCTACRSSCHRGRLSLDASSHDYKRWQNSRSLCHNTGRMLSAFAGSHHNRRTPSQALGLMELVNHILSFILKQHIRRYDGYQWAISLGVEERAQAGYLLGDPSSGLQGQPFIFKFEVVGLALGYATLAVKVVDPMLAYDSWWASFIDHLPQSEVG